MNHAGLAMVVGGALLLACSGGDSGVTNSTTVSPSDDSTGPGDSTTTASAETTTSGGSQSGTGSTTVPTAADDTSTGGTGDETGIPCDPGTEGCPCDDSGGCDEGLVCVDGSACLPTTCDADVFEPNDDEANAYFLGEINDNDGNGGIVSASLHHPGDVDWFAYQGDDDVFSNVDPAREIVSSAGVRLCKFLECDNGVAQTEFECTGGSQYAFSPDGRPGCCAMGDVELPDLNCTGVTEDNAMVYLRIDQPEDACVTYSASYHY